MQIGLVPTTSLARAEAGHIRPAEESPAVPAAALSGEFVQATFDAAGPPDEATLVIGGDGRFRNREALQTIVRLAGGGAETGEPVANISSTRSSRLDWSLRGDARNSRVWGAR